MRWLTVVIAVVRRPSLWGTAARQTVRLAPAGWWRQAPFLPVPGDEYLRFRMQTQYGDPEHRPDPGDVVDYLAWCRRWDRTVSAK